MATSQQQNKTLHMDVKYIGGDVPWTLPFGDHFYSASQASFNETTKNNFISATELETIARRYDFEPFYSASETQIHRDQNSQWMNAGVLFTDKIIEPDLSGMDKTEYTDNHGHTFCYLCSINQHEHERTKPRDQSQRRKLIPYKNPKALKARSSSLDRLHHDANTSHLIPYRFIVRTGTGKGHGARAKVFLYMYGTENNWTSIDLQARSNANTDGFPRGSIRTFCLKGPEIGQLHHLNVNLVGARSDKAWFLKEIEITNLNTSVSWLCEFNCWLPKKGHTEDERYHVKPSVNPQKELRVENLAVYILQIRTGGKPFAGTDSNIHVLIRGSTGHTRRLALTSNQANLFEQNQLDTFAIVGWDIGDLLEMTVDSDRSQLASDWDLKEIIMWRIMPDHDRQQGQVYFPFNTWLGEKASTLKAKRDAYSPAEYHPRGPTCYHIAVKTGKKLQAGTDANVFLIIYGRNGRTTVHLLDNPGINDFEQGSISEFMIMDIDVGEIDRIKIGHDNTGVGPAWYLDSVIIRKKHSTYRQVTDIFIERLEQASNTLYRQAREHLQKINKTRASSAKENDRSSLHSRDYEDSGNSRGILRSPIPNDRANLQKRVTWVEHGMGSHDGSIPIDTKRMKPTPKDVLSQSIEAGHFDHHAHWISTHNYAQKKWQIQSIEEQNPLNFDGSVRSALLQDRTASSSKIKSTVNERDDDVYEFEANRWLSKDEGDRKLEVSLAPKSTKLSAQTMNAVKSKSSLDKTLDSKKKQSSSSDLRYDKYEREHPERSTKSDLGPLARSPRDASKTYVYDPRSSKRQDEPSIDKHYRSAARSSKEMYTPAAGGKDLAALMADQSFRDKYPMESHERSSKSDVRSSERSLRDKYPMEPHERSSKSDVLSSDRSLRDTLKTHFDDSHSSKRRDESPIDRHHRPSSRASQEPHTPSAGEREPSNTFFSQSHLEKMHREYAGHPSKLDLGRLDRSPRETSKAHLEESRASQRSQPSLSNSSRPTHEPTTPSVGYRDFSSKPPTDSSYRPKSAARSTAELSSTRATRNQTYSSAYGTIPMDDF